ncbi:MAG: pyridoxamine 5'-phosphate oxidase family protein [Desulfobulbaceae bacterium]|nr:pyridoxamine 5'-phosphate oxidase family protein [Desulfobulbaceae bacterium]
MNLKDYFRETGGRGVFSSAGTDGRVTSAIYSSPHVMDDDRLAFILREHLTYANLQENPYAVYLFMEGRNQLDGVRLYLKKSGEDNDHGLLASMTRRHLTPEEDKAKGPKHIVYFEVEKILPLVGDGPGKIGRS